MTIVEARERFNRLIDEVRQDEGTDYEFSSLMNFAAGLVVQELLFPDKNPELRRIYSFDSNSHSAAELQHLVTHFSHSHEPYLFTDDYGRVHFSDIQSHFEDDVVYNESGNLVERRKPDVMHISALGIYHDGTVRPVKWASHNEYQSMINDPFWKPTLKYPLRIDYQDVFKILPDGKFMLDCMVVRRPKMMWLLDGVSIDPDLSDSVMEKVLLKAVQLKGIEQRDYQLLQAGGIIKEDL